MQYNSQGLKRETALQIASIIKHQYFYRNKKSKKGRKTSLLIAAINSCFDF